MSDNVRVSQTKPNPLTKLPVADKERDSQPKLSPTLKIPVANKLCMILNQNLAQLKFSLADKAWHQKPNSQSSQFSNKA